MAGAYNVNKERRQNLRPFRWGGWRLFFYLIELLGRGKWSLYDFRAYMMVEIGAEVGGGREI